MSKPSPVDAREDTSRLFRLIHRVDHGLLVLNGLLLLDHLRPISNRPGRRTPPAGR